MVWTAAWDGARPLFLFLLRSPDLPLSLGGEGHTDWGPNPEYITPWAVGSKRRLDGASMLYVQVVVSERQCCAIVHADGGSWQVLVLHSYYYRRRKKWTNRWMMDDGWRWQKLRIKFGFLY